MLSCSKNINQTSNLISFYFSGSKHRNMSKVLHYLTSHNAGFPAKNIPATFQRQGILIFYNSTLITHLPADG